MSEGITFGGWLKQRRRESGVTQEELAESIGCSGTAIRKIEIGERHPSGQVAQLLADYLKIPDDEHEAFVTFARSGRAACVPVETAHGDTGMRAPWRNAYLHQTNLPAMLTTLIGREQETATARDYLTNPKIRLLTLTGAPGIGKTRLALQVASDLVERFEDGVFVVELAPVVDPGLVLQEVARALNLKEITGRDMESVLLDYVHERKMLLILDNFEQVLDAAASIVKLMEASPWLKVLVTSREALHVRGERRFSVPSLGLPDISRLSGPARDRTDIAATLTSIPSVQLFVERGQDVNPDFELTRENAADIAMLCVGLDGLPLAIELAAARANHLTPAEMRGALENRLKLLTGGGRDLSTRHRTLRGAIEWSYDLLDNAEQGLFRRLGIFAGGCTLAAIQDVSDDAITAVDADKNGNIGIHGNTGQSAKPISSVIESLIDKNMVVQHPRSSVAGEVRYSMLEAIREYALAQLEHQGEFGNTRRRHAEYYLGLAEQAETHLMDADQLMWLDRLEHDHENLRSVLLWAAQQGAREVSHTRAGNVENETFSALETGLRLAGALWRFWYIRGNMSEGRQHLEAALALAERAKSTEHLPGYRAKALQGLATLMQDQGEYANVSYLFNESLSIWRNLGDMARVASSLNNLAALAFEQGDYTHARTLYEESLSVRREIGDKVGIASSLNNLGTLAYELRDFENARSLNEESLSIRRETGDRAGIAMSLNNLAILALEQKDYERARSLHMESLTIKREMGNKAGIARSLGNLAYMAQEQENYEEAASLYRESLSLRQEVGDRVGIMACLIALGFAKAETGEPRQAARLLGAASALLETMPGTLQVEEIETYQRGLASAQVQLGEREFREALEEGQAIAVAEAINNALAGTWVLSGI